MLCLYDEEFELREIKKIFRKTQIITICVFVLYNMSVYPTDTELSEKLLVKDAHKEALEHAIEEYLNFNIVECEVING